MLSDFVVILLFLFFSAALSLGSPKRIIWSTSGPFDLLTKRDNFLRVLSSAAGLSPCPEINHRECGGLSLVHYELASVHCHVLVAAHFFSEELKNCNLKPTVPEKITRLENAKIMYSFPSRGTEMMVHNEFVSQHQTFECCAH